MFKLVRTCFACPEQYDVFLHDHKTNDDKQVGYIRLRHGSLSVECPNCGGKEVYSATPNGDGIFDDDERDFYLRYCLDAIQKWVEDEKSAPDIPYYIVEK